MVNIDITTKTTRRKKENEVGQTSIKKVLIVIIKRIFTKACSSGRKESQ